MFSRGDGIAANGRERARGLVRGALLACVALVAVGTACADRRPHVPNGEAGEGGGGNDDVDASAPTVRIVFPPEASYSDATIIEVRGTAGDDREPKLVTVNGVDAVSDDDFVTWRARVPLDQGMTELRAVATDAAGNRGEDTVVVTNEGPPIGAVRELAWDGAGRRLIIGNDVDAIVAVDPETRAVTMISDPRDGEEPPIRLVGAVAFDPVHERALVVDTSSNALIAVDLATGTRSLVSASVLDPDYPLREALAIDPTGRTAFVMGGRGGDNAVLQIDLATGERNVLSDETTGEGPALEISSPALVYDAVTDPRRPRLLASQPDAGSIFAIDLETGDRSVFMEPIQADSGAEPAAPLYMALDAAEGRLLVTCSTFESSLLLAVDLTTGQSTRLVGVEPDPSVWNFWHGIAHDVENGTIYTGIGGFSSHRESDLLAIDLETLEQTTLGNARVGRGRPIADGSGAALQFSGGDASTLLVGDFRRQTLVHLDLTDGDRNDVSGPDRGTGPSLLGPLDIELEAGAEKPSALVLDAGNELQSLSDRLLRIDLESGDRSVISGDGRGAGPELFGARELALDAERRRVLTTCPGCDEQGLYAIDLDDGNRTLVSSVSRGTGQEPGFLIGLAVDTSSDRALVVTSQQILAIDLESGNRTELAPRAGAESPYALDVLSGIAFDATHGRALVLSLSSRAVLSLDMNDASRSLLSGGSTFRDGVGSGPALAFPRDVAADFQAGLAYVRDADRGAVFAIDLHSGERVIVSR